MKRQVQQPNLKVQGSRLVGSLVALAMVSLGIAGWLMGPSWKFAYLDEPTIHIEGGGLRGIIRHTTDSLRPIPYPRDRWTHHVHPTQMLDQIPAQWQGAEVIPAGDYYQLRLVAETAYQLAGDIMVMDSLSLVSGSLDLRGNVLTLGPDATLRGEAGNLRIFDSEGGYIEHVASLVPDSAHSFAGMGLDLRVQVPGYVTARRGHAPISPTPQIRNGTIKRWFQVLSSESVDTVSELTLSWLDAELDQIPASHLCLFHSQDQGHHWRLIPDAERDLDNRTFRVTTQAASGIWAFGDPMMGQPIELESWHLESGANGPILQWRVGDHGACQSFMIERTTDLVHWEGVAEVPVKRNGIYEWSDPQPLSESVLYRVVQLNPHGMRYHTPAIRWAGLWPMGPELVPLWNPQYDLVQLFWHSPKRQLAQLTVHDEYGIPRFSFDLQLHRGGNSLELMAQTLPAGPFFLSWEVDHQTNIAQVARPYPLQQPTASVESDHAATGIYFQK
ncbi:hypothetical protein [Pontibacter sp. G13]|uniref:hypothetical protein n=1 Tax=Pontibacter sp. G13 TaxID=3074898 RepID=UPI00288C08F7|nr:hypothetical protein [Pontibacter sp. G13]WNJ16671.1 hypothetical protein RJD25_17535 [Pontibacter sp. G13]